MTKKIYDGKGLLSNGNPILEIDDNGKIYNFGAFNMRECVGHVDNLGNIYKSTLFGGTYVGRFDQKGNIFDDKAFGGNYVGNINKNGVLRDHTALGGNPTDSVGLGLTKKAGSGSSSKHNPNVQDEGLGISEIAGATIGILGMAIIYVIYKVLKCVAYYFSAVKALYMNTSAGLITVAAILIPIAMFIFIDWIYMGIHKRTNTACWFANFWINHIRTPKKSGYFPLLIGYLCIVFLIVSVIAMSQNSLY